jgi:hypothetical protein
MRFVKASILMMALLAVGVGAVSANFTDGRVNSWEAGAPAAVYCKYADDLHTTFSGIEVLRIDGETNNGVLALYATAEEIDAVDSQPATSTLITSESGYSLYRLPSGEFELFAPADAEGKVYSFVWERGDEGC